MDDGEKFADLPPEVQQAIALGMGAQPMLHDEIDHDPRLAAISHSEDRAKKDEKIAAAKDTLYHPPKEDWPQT